ncbi:MAG: hypothetical protein PHN34_01225 [Kiritimatiellae bacterium]|nr:hypothetical protein [Kiritimatiellia bacterium]MDD4172835.1 hypothetical protein [Kiritimatiellia bacterium]MDD4440660.1 hypothetical protein [Kiritimatiellia bacterium]HQL50266.1 hypothetical protein [Kiritimatiellia bacterium]
MDVIENMPLEPATNDEALSRTELQIEQEKLKLERERILLERERLESVRERVQAQEGLHTDQNGRLAVKLSTLILVSIICTLVGGILGALSTSTHLDRRNTARLQEVMQTLAASATDAFEVTTNTADTAGSEMPAWLKAMKPKGAHAGISLVVIQ